MHKIYFEKRCIVICPPGEGALADSNSVEFRPGAELGLGPLERMIEQTSSLSKI